MFSFSRKYDLLHYEFCLALNFVILLCFNIENVHASLQAALNLQDSFSELASNQLSSSQMSAQMAGQSAANSALAGQLIHLNHQQLNNQSSLDNAPGSEQHPLAQPMIMQNFQDQNGLWSMPLDKSSLPSPNLDYPSTLLPTLSAGQFAQALGQSAGSFDYNNPLANSMHNSSPSISSLSTFQSPRPFNNENHNPNFNANPIYNDSPNINHHHNHHSHHSRPHSANTASITVQP